MKFVAQEDVAAPIEYVFARLTDYEAFEREALRHGAKVERTAGGRSYGEGTEWDLAFEAWGKHRKMTARIAEFDRPNGVLYRGRIKGLVTVVNVETLSLSPNRTRMSVSVKLVPKTMRAKLLVQSLRLTKNKVGRRLRTTVGQFAERMEEDFKKIA